MYRTQRTRQGFSCRALSVGNRIGQWAFNSSKIFFCGRGDGGFQYFCSGGNVTYGCRFCRIVANAVLQGIKSMPVGACGPSALHRRPAPLGSFIKESCLLLAELLEKSDDGSVQADRGLIGENLQVKRDRSSLAYVARFPVALGHARFGGSADAANVDASSTSPGMTFIAPGWTRTTPTVPTTTGSFSAAASASTCKIISAAAQRPSWRSGIGVAPEWSACPCKRSFRRVGAAMPVTMPSCFARVPALFPARYELQRKL